MPIPQRMHSSMARSLTETEGGNDAPLYPACPIGRQIVFAGRAAHYAQRTVKAFFQGQLRYRRPPAGSQARGLHEHTRD